MRRLARTALVVAGLAGTSLTAACGDDGEPAGATSVAGTYTLRTVNGAALPATLAELDLAGSSYKLELLGGSITLAANGTFTETHRWRETEDGAVTTTDEPGSGTYTRQGSAITLRLTSGEQLAGTLAADALTISVQDEVAGTVTARYTK